MTKVGILSDIHGDVASLDSALVRIREMGCTLVLCPGDLLDGVEPFSEEVVQRVKAENVVAILGNHERWALERRRRQPDPRKFAPPIAELPDISRGSAEGLRPKLSRESIAYLRTLPSRRGGVVEGVRLAMHHARPGSDMEGITVETTPPALRRRLLAQAGAEVLIVGHTHDAFNLATEKGRIINPGACCSKTYGKKTTEDYRPATFGVLELPSKRFTVFRVVDGERVARLRGLLPGARAGAAPSASPPLNCPGRAAELARKRRGRR